MLKISLILITLILNIGFTINCMETTNRKLTSSEERFLESFNVLAATSTTNKRKVTFKNILEDNNSIINQKESQNDSINTKKENLKKAQIELLGALNKLIKPDQNKHVLSEYSSNLQNITLCSTVSFNLLIFYFITYYAWKLNLLNPNNSENIALAFFIPTLLGLATGSIVSFYLLDKLENVFLYFDKKLKEKHLGQIDLKAKYENYLSCFKEYNQISEVKTRLIDSKTITRIIKILVQQDKKEVHEYLKELLELDNKYQLTN